MLSACPEYVCLSADLFNHCRKLKMSSAQAFIFVGKQRQSNLHEYKSDRQEKRGKDVCLISQ